MRGRPFRPVKKEEDEDAGKRCQSRDQGKIPDRRNQCVNRDRERELCLVRRVRDRGSFLTTSVKENAAVIGKRVILVDSRYTITCRFSDDMNGAGTVLQP